VGRQCKRRGSKKGRNEQEGEVALQKQGVEKKGGKRAFLPDVPKTGRQKKKGRRNAQSRHGKEIRAKGKKKLPTDAYEERNQLRGGTRECEESG